MTSHINMQASAYVLGIMRESIEAEQDWVTLRLRHEMDAATPQGGTYFRIRALMERLKELKDAWIALNDVL